MVSFRHVQFNLQAQLIIIESAKETIHMYSYTTASSLPGPLLVLINISQENRIAWRHG